MRRVLALVAAILTAAALPATAQAAQAHSEKIIFDGGGDDVLNGIRYHSFRIPALVRTT